MGAISAAVAYWEEYAWLDDAMARRQLQVLVSPDSPQTIDKQVSAVRTLREGVGLPPSGPAPAGVTFSTVVEAVRGKSLTKDGGVVQICWSTTGTPPSPTAEGTTIRSRTSPPTSS